MNLFLIGYRCTGKTTVGKMLARHLGRQFIDTDAEIQRTHGMTIQHIVRAQGWEGFREKEKKILHALCQRPNQVIGTGGGIILEEENVRAMKRSGRIFWLKASVETIRERMQNDEQSALLRPSLTSTDAEMEIEPVLASRIRLYAKAADAVVETDGVDPDEVCRRILNEIEKRETNP